MLLACAPAAIQRLTFSVSVGVITLMLTSINSFLGGISPDWTRFNRRLCSGWPGTMAGPDFPPFSMEARERRSSPPSCLLMPWQTVHRRYMMGMTSCSVISSGGTGGWLELPASDSIQERMAANSASFRWGLPIGILPSRTTWYKRLSSGLPGTTTGPDSLPFSTPSRVLRFISFMRVPSPWQAVQLEVRMGWTSLEKLTVAAPHRHASPVAKANRQKAITLGKSIRPSTRPNSETAALEAHDSRSSHG